MTFFFVWQAEFGMCFGVAPSAYRSCGTHFPIFWTFPMACIRMEMVVWETPNCSASIFCNWVSSSSKRACNWQSSTFWADFRASCYSGQNCHWTETNPCTLFLIKYCCHRSPSIRCDSAANFFKLKQKSKASRICFFFSKKLDMITKEKMYVVVWNCWWCALIHVDRCQTHKKKCVVCPG